MGVPDYSATASSNTSINGVNIDEGCPPGNINNAIREVMADLKAYSVDNALPDILGTVSMDGGGVPDGAIFEAGSNASGSYVKLASGLMICTGRYSLGAGNAEGTGDINTNPYSTAVTTLPYAAAFKVATLPVLNIMGQNGSTSSSIARRQFFPTFTEHTNTGVLGFRMTLASNVSTTAGIVAHLIAIGVWY